MPPMTSLQSSATTSDHPRNLGPQGLRRLVWMIGLSHAINHFVMLIFPAVLLLVQAEFGLGYAGLGLLASVAFACYGLLALPAGILTDRLGGERVLAVWLLGGSVACCTIGLSTGPWSLAIGLALLGLFASLHHPAGSGILVVLRHRMGANVSKAFGLSGILGNIGIAGSPILAAAIGVRWGWRAAFFAGSIPGLLLCIPLWQWPRDATSRAQVSAAADSPSKRPSAASAFGLPLLLLFGFETLMGFVLQGSSTFLPAHLAGRAGIEALTAAQVQRGGAFASLALLFGGFGHLAAGRLMVSRRQDALFLGTIATTTLCLFGMGLMDAIPLVACSILFSFTFFGLGTISNTFMAMHTPAHMGGTIFGITFTLAFGVGSLASSVMGIVAERFGLSGVFLGLGLVSAGGVMVVAAFGAVRGTWRCAKAGRDAAGSAKG